MKKNRDTLEEDLKKKWRAYWKISTKKYYEKNRSIISKKNKEKRKLSKTTPLEIELS